MGAALKCSQIYAYRPVVQFGFYTRRPHLRPHEFGQFGNLIPRSAIRCQLKSLCVKLWNTLTVLVYSILSLAIVLH
jgi:hypothetical protein